MNHVYHRRVHFADTDAAGVVHFSRLLCYAEEAEHELLGSLGVPLLGGGGWPRVCVECNYLAPVRMGDDVVVAISTKEVGKTSVNWRFSMEVSDRQVACGEMKTVRVDACGIPAKLPGGLK